MVTLYFFFYCHSVGLTDTLTRQRSRGFGLGPGNIRKKWFCMLVSEVRDLDLFGAEEARTGDCYDNKELKGNDILCVLSVFLPG